MKICNKFWQFLGFSLACGMFSSIPAGIICCMTFMFFLLPLMPIIFIPCWLFGSIFGWVISNSKTKLTCYTFLFSILASVIIGFCILHKWFYPKDVVACLIWTYLFAGIFAGCSYPGILYIKKKIMNDIF